MCSPQLSLEITDKEQVARVLFAPSYISEGRVSPTAFRWYRLNNKPETYISVLRDNGEDIDAQSAKIRPREKGDSRYGYSWLKVKDIRSISGIVDNSTIDVKSYPTKKLPNHAGIEVYINGTLVNADTPTCSEISIIQKHLAKYCSLPIPFSVK